MLRAIVLTLTLAGLCVTVQAEEGILINDLIGVKAISPEILNAMTCRELYAAATSVEPDTQNYRSTLINENTDIVVSTVGTMFKPALYVYTVTIPWHFKEDYRMVHTNLTLDDIRRRMSALNCFQK